MFRWSGARPISYAIKKFDYGVALMTFLYYSTSDLAASGLRKCLRMSSQANESRERMGRAVISLYLIMKIYDKMIKTLNM